MSYASNSRNSNVICPFLDQNPQITTLKIYSAQDEIQCIAEHVTKVQSLSIFRQHYWSVVDIRPLNTLNNLRKLSLSNLRNEDLHGVLSGLCQFQFLEELELHVFCCESGRQYNGSEVQQSIIKLAQAMSHSLERIQLFGIALMETTVLEFIRLINNLKEIHIHDCELKITPKFISDLAEVLKSSQPQNDTKPLKLSIDYLEGTSFREIKKLDIGKYLRVSDEQCYHKCYRF